MTHQRRDPPMHLAIGSTSHLTVEFVNFMFPHEANPTERRASQQACRDALEELRTEKPDSWAVIQAHWFNGQKFPAYAADAGITLYAAQKRGQRAMEYLTATALRIKADRGGVA